VCLTQVQDLQAELAEKQEQLQALSLENLALVAKARALEQLVKSAGGLVENKMGGGGAGGKGSARDASSTHLGTVVSRWVWDAVSLHMLGCIHCGCLRCASSGRTGATCRRADSQGL
jgi:hypothetical protein